MASEKDKYTPLKLRGLNKDKSFSNETDGTMSFSLNSVIEDETGNRDTVSTEKGNELYYSLPIGQRFVGAVNLNRKDVLIFSTDETTDMIGLAKEGGNYELLVKTTGFNFNIDTPIKGTFRLIKGCERAVYWIQDGQPDRQINIDSLEDYTQDGYTVAEANLQNAWDINEFRLQPNALLPIVTNLEETSGGLLQVGQYSFAIEILDDNLNRITLHHTPGNIAISPDPLYQEFRTITGASNIDNTTVDVGGVPLVNKAILLEIDNLDTRFRYYRVWVLRKSSSDGQTIEVFQKNEVNPITASTDNYIFTGIQDIDTRENLEEITVPRAFYESSKEITQIDNRLVRANVINQRRDYSNYQRIVNEITVEYITKNSPIEDATVAGNSKNSSTYFKDLSNMGNEVYARGIVFVFNTGEISPVFHIPGRPSNDTDTELITVVENNPGFDEVTLADVRHLGLSIGDTIERWKVFNTADMQGMMAYWEAENATYPITKDCNDEYIYGELAGLPIRHHKYPDRSKVKLFEDEDTAVLIGTKYSNVQYPDDDIAGHFFVAGRRDEFNRTIVDKCYVSPYNPEFVTPAGINDLLSIGSMISQANADTKHARFLSPKLLFTNVPFSGDHLSIESILLTIDEDTDPWNIAEEWEYTYKPPDAPNPSTVVNDQLYYGYHLKYTKMQWNAYLHNREIEAQAIYNPDTGGGSIDLSTTVKNVNAIAKAGAIKTTDSLPDLPGLASAVTTGGPIFNPDPTYELLYAGIKVNRDIHPNLSSIPYYISYPELFSTSESEIYDGDIIITPMKYSSLAAPQFDPLAEFTKPPLEGIFYEKLMIESELNIGMRNYGLLPCNTFFIYDRVAGDLTSPIDRPMTEFFITKFLNLNDDQEYFLKDPLCEDFYYYNNDYTVQRYGRVFYQLPITWEYCNTCINEQPNRIIWSPKSFSDELTDTYKILYVNDYTIVGTDPITNIHYDQNRMLVTSTDSAFVMSPNPRTLQTDVDTVYLSSGDFLSIPANEIVRRKIGYAGSQSRYSDIETEFGYTYVDQQAGEVFNFTSSNGLDKISAKGLTQWFEENLPSKLVEQLAEYDITYDYKDSPINRIGLQATYDPRYKRYILHKTDYEILNFGGLYPGEQDYGDKLFYNPDGSYFFTLESPNVEVQIELGDPAHFKNRSWTISYNYLTGSWQSWHSYQPSFMYHDVDTFYTADASNNMWIHGKGEFLSYYGNKYPFIIEYPLSTISTTDLNALEWYSRARIYNEETKQWEFIDDVTFTDGMVYTEEQCTGQFRIITLDKDLNPYGIFPGWSNFEKLAIPQMKVFRINELRDITTALNFLTSSWEFIAPQFNMGDDEKQGYIDLVYNPGGVDYNKNQHLLSELTDKFFIIRLIYDPRTANQGDVQLILDIINSKNFLQNG